MTYYIRECWTNEESSAIYRKIVRTAFTRDYAAKLAEVMEGRLHPADDMHWFDAADDRGRRVYVDRPARELADEDIPF